MRKYGWNVVLVLLLGVIMAWILLGMGEPRSIIESMKSLAPKWLAIGIVCILLYLGVETIIQHMLTNKMQRGHSLWNAFKVVMTGQFFNAITPFASGGQPMQAYMMAKQGVPVGTSISILMTKFIIYQLILTVYSFIVLILQLSFFCEKINGLVYLSVIGFLINLGVVTILVASAFMKEPLKKAGFWGINLLHRMRIIKHPTGHKRNIIAQIDLFNKNIGLLRKNAGLLLQVSMLTAMQLTAYFIIPYTIYRAFGLSGTKVFVIIAAAAFILMISSFMPVPGGSGVAEGSFFLFFQLFFPNTILPTAILCWRLLTFYIPLSIGGVMTMLPNRKVRVLADSRNM